MTNSLLFPLDVECCKHDYSGPTSESNWIIPGRVLVGAFPAAPCDMETFTTLSAIMNEKVTMFVCLQEEYAPIGPDNCRELWESGQTLRPYFDDAMMIAKNRDKFENCAGIVPAEKLRFRHLPIRDCSVIDDELVLDFAKQLVASIKEGEVLYIHCWGGHGRTGSIVCLLLHLMYGFTAQECLVRCQYLHDIRIDHANAASPQTMSQRRQLRRIINKLQNTIV